MIGKRVSTVALLCMSLVHAQVVPKVACSANSSALRVTFDSTQNYTGHWHHSVILNRAQLRGLHYDKDTGPWSVDVDYNPENCGVASKDSLLVVVSFDARPSGKRHPDYKFYPGVGYYKVNSVAETWAAAKANCEKEGGHLVIVNSQKEADLMKQLLVNSADTWAWVGLVKIDAKGEFVTVFGDPISSTGYSRWHAGVNPSSAAASYAAVIHKAEATLHYEGNTAKHVSVCEQELK